VVYITCMSRASSSLAISLAVALSVGTGCKDKPAQKKAAPTAGSAATKKRPSPKAAAMEEVLLWDASVQKMQEEVAKAEAAGDVAKADDFRAKLKVSQDGLEQAKRKLKMLETVEQQDRQNGSGSTPNL
jgi:hypothetical protein